ncbi:MAG TPA: PRC-barrel domain containing protein [bacterium]|nr:PRC-barrel domain containing protein [bacterium]
MLRSISELQGYQIQAVDGKLGKVHDFFFDDLNWTVRYLVVDTGSWLPGRLVLVSPHSIQKPQWAERTLPVVLTKEQIENSPPVSQDEPVSRRHEKELAKYYEWPAYWHGGTIGLAPGPPVLKKIAQENEKELEKGDPNLRSIREVTGYKIKAKDSSMGYVEDFIVDETNWIIRYLVVNSRNRLFRWLPGGRKVLLSPVWIEKVKWAESSVFVDLKKDQIKNSPKYDPSTPINREYEVQLYDFYGRPVYWK